MYRQISLLSEANHEYKRKNKKGMSKPPYGAYFSRVGLER